LKRTPFRIKAEGKVVIEVNLCLFEKRSSNLIKVPS